MTKKYSRKSRSDDERDWKRKERRLSCRKLVHWTFVVCLWWEAIFSFRDEEEENKSLPSISQYLQSLKYKVNNFVHHSWMESLESRVSLYAAQPTNYATQHTKCVTQFFRLDHPSQDNVYTLLDMQQLLLSFVSLTVFSLFLDCGSKKVDRLFQSLLSFSWRAKVFVVLDLGCWCFFSWTSIGLQSLLSTKQTRRRIMIHHKWTNRQKVNNHCVVGQWYPSQDSSIHVLKCLAVGNSLSVFLSV